MKIHHLNCGSMCPIGGSFPSLMPAQIGCHCLLVEAPGGLLLVDSGFGLQDVQTPSLVGPMRWVLGAQLRKEETAIEQVRALGFQPEDVRWIIPTHLDLDHAGGIADFPWAEVHIWKSEYDFAHDPKAPWLKRQRYKPHQYKGHEKWVLHEECAGEAWKGWEVVRQVPGLPPELLLVPLQGHSIGHWGIAIDRVSHEEQEDWLFHVGDAYYDRGDLKPKPDSPALMRYFQRVSSHNYKQARANQCKLFQMAEQETKGLQIISSHDNKDFQACIEH